MKENMKKAGLFTLVMLPLGVVAGFFVAQYEMGTGVLTKEMMGDMSESLVCLMITAQTAIYAVICSFVGYLSAAKTGLIRKFDFRLPSLKKTLIYSVICGLVFFGAEFFIFTKCLPPVAAYYDAYPFSFSYFMGEVVYGGVIEELIMRLFLMSLLVLIIWKIFARKESREAIPTWIFIVSNVVVALCFAAGHIPATLSMFGYLDAFILIRCFVMNGFFGVIYGYLYRKQGIQHAMLCHALTHVVCDLLFYAVS